MFYLVNTFHSSTYHVGAVVSRHKTIDAAAKAGERLGRDVKKSHGQNSYLPWTVCESEAKIESGKLFARDAGRQCETEEYAHVIYA